MGLLWLLSVSTAASGFSLTSPDRPAVWFNRAGDKLNEQLSWDSSKQELIYYVAYNRTENMPTRDQTLYDTFQLSFPMVRLDASSNLLYFIGKGGHRITIGHLESGFFGTQVVLNDDVQLFEDRTDGIVRATIATVGRARDK